MLVNFATSATAAVMPPRRGSLARRHPTDDEKHKKTLGHEPLACVRGGQRALWHSFVASTETGRSSSQA
jgi:hypothetical protein